MSEYGNLMDDMYAKAEVVGESQKSVAWLNLDEVWWPNPHYIGEAVAHPECDTEFHPPKKTPNLKERYEEYLKNEKC